MSTTARKAKRPKCIVMPFQETPGSGIGMALHFLLGNVLAVHTDFAECWFGWRVGKIFTTAEALRAYYRSPHTAVDRAGVSREQQIRYFVYGRMADDRVHLTLFDGDRTDASDAGAATLPFDTADHLIDFRQHFLDWLAECGRPISASQESMTAWPERTSIEGLRRIGLALEGFYIHSAYATGTARLDTGPFEAACAAAPDSFMANNLLGWAHYRNADATAAKAAFLRALDFNPHAVGPMAGLMWCAVLENDEAEAVRWASRKAAMRAEDVAAAAEKTRRRFHG